MQHLVSRRRWQNLTQINLQRGRNVGCHLAERFGGRADVDRLPVAVQHQHNCLVQDVAHKVFAHRYCSAR